MTSGPGQPGDAAGDGLHAGCGVAHASLLQPIRLRQTNAPNRVLFGPHPTNLCHGRAVGSRHVAYYARRAVGGCGIVVIETASVLDNDWPYERAPLVADCSPGWAAVASAVHREGAVALASLGHCGGQGSSAYSQAPLWAPSRFTDPASRETPQQMEPEDIASTVDAFRAAARSAAAAGLDGVEIQAGTRSLVRQFLSGLTNTRGDEYGTDRLCFARDVLLAARQGLGPGPVLGLRLGCDELAPWAGITPEGSVDIARALAPLVDYVVAVRASAYDAAATYPDGHTEAGFARPLAAALRATLPAHVAVAAQGSIVDVAMAAEVVASGEADLVEMTRAQIADPDLVGKVAAGQADRVRPCVLCNQRCQVADVRNPIVSCIGEPRSGYEDTDLDPVPVMTDTEPATGSAPATADPVPGPPAGEAQQVLVVGGGPAGLEAARVAAARGHSVTLVERAPRTGGWVRAAAAGAGRGRLERLVDWLAAECERLGVVVRTGTALSPEALEAARASGTRVVLCTGSASVPPTTEGDGSVHVVSAAEVLAAVAALGAPDAPGVPSTPALPDGPVVVHDLVGDSVGVSVAELLAAAGRDVTMVTGDLVVGTQLTRTGDLAPANARLARAGVRVVRRALVTGAAGGSVHLEDCYSGQKDTLPAAALVEAGYRVPDALPDASRTTAPPAAETTLAATHAPHATHATQTPAAETVPWALVAGDAVAPRTIAEAVLEGRRAALALEEAQ